MKSRAVAGGGAAVGPRDWQKPVLRVLAPLAVLLALVGWALYDTSQPMPVMPGGAPWVLAAITGLVALGARALRRSFGIDERSTLSLPDPLYTLYLAAVILSGGRVAVLIAAVTPLIEYAPDMLRSRRLVARALWFAAWASATTFVAGLIYASMSRPFASSSSALRANFIAALAASAVMLAGVALVRVFAEQPANSDLPRALSRYFSSHALRFQILLLSIGPLLPLAAQLDDVEAEFAWLLFLVPLGAVYYLALVSVRLQQRTDQLQETITQLRASRRREAELTDYAVLITRAQEDERRRLARELHDDTAQALIALSRGLDTLSNRQVNPPLSSYDTRFVGELGDLAKRTLESVRRACQDLRPSVLDDLGLCAALESLAHSVSQRGLPCAFQQSGEPCACAPEVEVTIYRIAQEALSNARHHAHARSATLDVTYGPTSVDLRVEDDGVGFDYASSVRGADHTADGASDERPGLGLLGMRERASLIGAHLRIESQPGQGTVVAVSAPVTYDASPVDRRAS